MRVRRKQSPDDIYHVVARGTGRQLIFEDDDDRRMFLDLLAKALNRCRCELYAWCLMGNHVHLLVHAPMDSVSACMKQLLGTYSQWFNQKSGRVGHLFQERFKSEPIDTDAYLIMVVRYIHANPEKAGICDARTYPWSSYHEYAGSPRLCETSFVLDAFGGPSEFARAGADGSEVTGCLDYAETGNPRLVLPDERALAFARDLLGIEPGDLKSLPKRTRDGMLAKLKENGFSVRQVERITGVGRNTVARA